MDIPEMQKVAELCGAAVRQSEKLAEAENRAAQAETRAASAESRLAEAEKKAEDFGKARAGFAKRATEAAKVLAERGVIDSDNVDTYVDKVAEDPNSVWDTVEKLAGMVSAPTLGGVSGVGSNSAADIDPFVREFLPGTGRGNGYID